MHEDLNVFASRLPAIRAGPEYIGGARVEPCSSADENTDSRPVQIRGYPRQSAEMKLFCLCPYPAFRGLRIYIVIRYDYVIREVLPFPK